MRWDANFSYNINFNKTFLISPEDVSVCLSTFFSCFSRRFFYILRRIHNTSTLCECSSAILGGGGVLVLCSVPLLRVSKWHYRSTLSLTFIPCCRRRLFFFPLFFFFLSQNVFNKIEIWINRAQQWTTPQSLFQQHSGVRVCIQMRIRQGNGGGKIRETIASGREQETEGKLFFA